MKKRKRTLRGFGDAETDRSSEAMKWLKSALKNYEGRKSGWVKNPCFNIEHFTDIIAEATAASALAPKDNSAIVKRAQNLASEVTQLQREAVTLCRRQEGKHTGAFDQERGRGLRRRRKEVKIDNNPPTGLKPI